MRSAKDVSGRNEILVKLQMYEFYARIYAGAGYFTSRLLRVETAASSRKPADVDCIILLGEHLATTGQHEECRSGVVVRAPRSTLSIRSET